MANQNTIDSKQAKNCFICTNNIKEIDYKDIQLMQKFISPYYKILPRKRSGLCAKHQRAVSKAIKRARIMALIPFTNDHK